ncbi:MAG: NUDIX hydrolase [Pseudomonadota bacterium]
MSKPPAKPRLAATVLLMRDAPELEVLMVERHYQIDFAAGALVFPGGKANDEDADAGWADLADGGFEGEQRAARIAATREAFEESGVLLARPRAARGQGAPLVGVDVADALGPHREAVDKRETSFLGLIRDHDLVLALDTLVHFGHWITPDMMPKRFDTHFYVTPAPEGQIAAHDGRETTDTVWTCPSKALEREKAGEATIIFPTRMNLIKLARARTVAEAVDTFSAEPIVTVLPVVGKDETGAPCLHIPAEAGYGQTTEPLENVKNVAR